MKKYLLILSIAFLIIVAACTTVQTQQEPITPKPEPKVETKPIEKPLVEPKKVISDAVKGLLDKSKVRVKNIYYKYRGPETGNNFHEFYVKDNKIKYRPAREIQALDRQDSYDVIFIDNAVKTAQSYCEAAYCVYKGKKADLVYGDVYILTVFDWINGITEATKVGEEVIDDRNTWKVQANNGILWLDTFYGIPLKVESNGKVYRFQQISVNSVQDSDVVTQ